MDKKPLLTAVSLVAGIFFTVNTVAADEGLYVSLMGGYASMTDETISASRTDLTTSPDAITFDGKSGIYGGSVGYETGSGLRFEAEVTYQEYDVEKILNESVVLVTASGNVKALTVGVNGIYDLSLDALPFKPYVGVGLGAVSLEANDVTRSGRTKLNKDLVTPTGVVMVGVGFDVTENITLSAGYRLQGIYYLEGSSKRNNGSAVSGKADAVMIQSATAGLRFNF